LALHWPLLDADLYVPSLIQGGFRQQGMDAKGQDGGGRLNGRKKKRKTGAKVPVSYLCPQGQAP